MKIVSVIVALILAIALGVYGYSFLSKNALSPDGATNQITDDEVPGKIVGVPEELLDPVSTFTPTEVYRGTDSAGDEIIFKQQDYTRYELTFEKLERRGDLNTERGWQDDADATVYILNWQRPADEQLVFVRTTAAPNVLTLLDASRKPSEPAVTLNLSE
jgi:hypothetical protein